MTLRLRLSLAFLLVVIVPLLVAAIVVGRGVPHALNTAADNRLAASRAGAAALVQQTCTMARLAAEVLAREAAGGASAAAQDVVTRELAGYAVVSDRHNRVIASAGQLPTGERPTPDELGSCSRSQPPATLLAAIADSVKVVGSGGASRGQAAVAIPLDATTVRRIAAATNADATLVAGGQVVATTERPGDARDLAHESGAMLREGTRVVGHRLATAVRIGPGRSVLVLSVHQPGVGRLEALLVAVLATALLLSAVLGWLLARVTTRPLAELSAAAARVAGGDLDTRIDIRSRDEVGQLAEAFNEMTDELRSYVGELENSRDELRGNLARLGDTLSSTHDLGRILTVILDTAIGSVRATAGAAYVVQPGRDELLLRAGRGLDRRGAQSRVRVGHGVTGSVAATGEAVRGRAGVDGVTLSGGEPSATELISVPMRTSGGVLGVLNLYDRADSRPFDAGDLETIRTFAGQAAVALDNVLLHQEAQRLSVTDGLTGLGNYRFFQTTLTREIERAVRFQRPLALLMLDLDLFKEVNDVHGHQVGNVVLVEVAERLRVEVREVDVVARYGGEEFVVVLPETAGEGAGLTADRICAAIRGRPFDVGEIRLPVTISIGVAVFPAQGDGAATLIRAADEALYAAKAAGRDQWRMATGPAATRSR
ncbi:MAG: two-component system, cell cycle response regulator [Frankiaceae bacterium]|nr:two-component system, cell cycle response regulator [Frankiaceae bacterium]